jgi:hypothetical protein
MSKNFRRGDRVIARNDFLGYYYPGRFCQITLTFYCIYKLLSVYFSKKGKLTKIVDTKHADVAFETGYKQKNLVFKYIHKLFDVHAYFTVIFFIFLLRIN